MAADSKHSVLQLASVLCENQTFLREKASNSDKYPWHAELQTTCDHKTRNDILERRSAEIRQLYEQCQDSADQCRCLEEEWLALVTEKDRNLRQQIEEENEQAKKNQMKQLYQVLETLGTFSFNKPKEAVLKRNLSKMYHQIGKYCSRNDIDITKKCTGDVKSPQVPTAPPPPQMLIPPPPPPPPPLTPLTTNKAATEKDCKNLLRKRSSMQNNQSTPQNQTNEELLKRIRNGCRSELRSTPFKRSPGGTPLKRQRRMSDSDTSDLLTLALKRKFQNVTVQSPKENESPRSVMTLGDLQSNLTGITDPCQCLYVA